MNFLDSASIWILFFLVYSFVGWFLEILIDIIFYHKLVNRGFLIGPICPIYGVGATLLTLLLGHVDNIFAVFFLAILISGTLEYFTSFIMEKIFRVRWWDYSHEFCNLHGRVCLRALAYFGVMGVLILKIINPILFGFLDGIPSTIRIVLAAVLLVAFLADIATSLWLIIKCRVTVGTMRADATDEITANVRAVLLNKSKLSRRLAKAFPTMKVGAKTSKAPKTPKSSKTTKSRPKSRK